MFKEAKPKISQAGPDTPHLHVSDIQKSNLSIMLWQFLNFLVCLVISRRPIDADLNKAVTW